MKNKLSIFSALLLTIIPFTNTFASDIHIPNAYWRSGDGRTIAIDNYKCLVGGNNVPCAELNLNLNETVYTQELDRAPGIGLYEYFPSFIYITVDKDLYDFFQKQNVNKYGDYKLGPGNWQFKKNLTVKFQTFKEEEIQQIPFEWRMNVETVTYKGVSTKLYVIARANTYDLETMWGVFLRDFDKKLETISFNMSGLYKFYKTFNGSTGRGDAFLPAGWGHVYVTNRHGEVSYKPRDFQINPTEARIKFNGRYCDHRLTVQKDPWNIGDIPSRTKYTFFDINKLNLEVNCKADYSLYDGALQGGSNTFSGEWTDENGKKHKNYFMNSINPGTGGNWGTQSNGLRFTRGTKNYIEEFVVTVDQVPASQNMKGDIGHGLYLELSDRSDKLCNGQGLPFNTNIATGTYSNKFRTHISDDTNPIKSSEYRGVMEDEYNFNEQYSQDLYLKVCKDKITRLIPGNGQKIVNVRYRIK